jgi:hypothetical protein
MYINFQLFKNSGLENSDIYFLAAAKQIEKTVLEELTEQTFNRLNSLGLLTTVKGRKGDNPLHNVRLSKKGKDLLNDLEQAPILEEDKTVFEWLKNYYLKADKEIGNGAKTQRHIRDFRIKSGIEKNNLITLVLDFLRENEERSRKLEYIWYYPKTAFATRFDLEESWLWNHYQKNKERLDNSFEKYE